MTIAFRDQASEGKIRVAGICFDVRVLPPGQVDKTDAIQLALEREGGDAVDVLFLMQSCLMGNLLMGSYSCASAYRRFLCTGSNESNQSLRATVPPRNRFSVFAAAPCRGLSLSR